MIECSYSGCHEDNYSTALLVVDAYSTKWFCDEHWKAIGFLFNNMVSKCIKNDGCSRNRYAEVDIENVYLSTVKFNSKFFDLCDKHYNIYEELLGINSLFGFD